MTASGEATTRLCRGGGHLPSLCFKRTVCASDSWGECLSIGMPRFGFIIPHPRPIKSLTYGPVTAWDPRSRRAAIWIILYRTGAISAQTAWFLRACEKCADTYPCTSCHTLYFFHYFFVFLCFLSILHFLEINNQIWAYYVWNSWMLKHLRKLLNLPPCNVAFLEHIIFLNRVKVNYPSILPVKTGSCGYQD